MSDELKRLIIPPPSMLETINKTAHRVAEKGASFENGLKANPEILSNMSFNFLKKENPYHLYYIQKVSEYRKNLTIESHVPSMDATDACMTQRGVGSPQSTLFSMYSYAGSPLTSSNNFLSEFSATREESAGRMLVPKSEFKILTLTARYIAVYGEGFGQLLKQSENFGRYFHFLEPSSPWNILFLRMYQIYSKIVDSREALGENVSTVYCSQLPHLVSRVFSRIDEKIMEEKKICEQLESDRREAQSALQKIRWDNFEIVETLDLS